jgi:hypothetical protein
LESVTCTVYSEHARCPVAYCGGIKHKWKPNIAQEGISSCNIVSSEISSQGSRDARPKASSNVRRKDSNNVSSKVNSKVVTWMHDGARGRHIVSPVS